MTGVGVRSLLDIIETRYDREAVLDALRSVKIVTRGSKPEAVLRELRISPSPPRQSLRPGTNS